MQEMIRHRKPHPYVVNFEFWAYNDSLVIPFAEYYMPYFPLGDLADLVYSHIDHQTYVPEMFIFKVFIQLISALRYLHEGFYVTDGTNDVGNSSAEVLPRFPGVLHRDIKVR